MGEQGQMARPAVMGLTFFPQQWKAVSAPDGPVLVLAGPGAGKTRCLTGRIAYLVRERGVDPARICAITFTNKAAQEIAARLRHGLDDLSEQMTLGTIHALCLQILRQQGRRLGLPAGFGVATEEHQRLVLNRLGVHSKRHRQLLLLFGRRRLDGHALTDQDEAAFDRYQRELRSNHLIDYDEMLSLTRALLESSAAVLAGHQARWDHVLVDEFQDLDAAQYAIVKLLAQSHGRLFAVGDDEQSIFSWRGADPEVIARFARDFGVSEPVVLDINCRCSRPIFEAARKILPPDRPLFPKQIATVRDSGFPVRAVRFRDEREEAAWVVRDLLAELAESGLRRGEYAVLYRTHQAGQAFEEALVGAGVPCQLAKGQALGDDPLIGQVVAALRVVLHPDSELQVEALARKAFAEALLADVGRMPGDGFLARLRAYAEAGVGADAPRCWRFLYQVENLKGLLRLHGTLRQLVDAVLAEGVGEFDSPLEGKHDRLTDPADLPHARELAEALLAAAASGGRVLLAPAGGLEVPVKVMLARVLPGLPVHYLTPAVEPGTGDLVLALGLYADAPGATTHAVPAGGRLRVTQVFKALQLVEARHYRNVFTDYVTFDTETTGKDVEHCEVIELAAARVRGGRVVDTFHALVRPSRPVSPQASAVHGYTDADLAGQPTLEEVWPRFRAFAGDDVLVVHNGRRFDIPILERQTAPWQGTRGLVWFDTLTLARNLFPAGGLRQEDLAQRFGVPSGRGHHALDDALCLAGVFEALQRERLRRSRRTCLADLLDCVALGAALEGRGTTDPDDATLLEAAGARALRRHAPVVDTYVEDSPTLARPGPAVETLLARAGGRHDWPGARGGQPPEDRHPESHARLCRLLDCVRAESLEEAVRELLDRAALSTSEGVAVDPDRVSLLTFHSTKGLEFSRVYLIGVEDNQLPGYYALAERKAGEVGEARRLLYVAMTRAKDRLTITCCAGRNDRPAGGTLFLDEMGLEPTSTAPAD